LTAGRGAGRGVVSGSVGCSVNYTGWKKCHRGRVQGQGGREGQGETARNRLLEAATFWCSSPDAAVATVAITARSIKRFIIFQS
jgi:hypothetical protein